MSTRYCMYRVCIMSYRKHTTQRKYHALETSLGYVFTNSDLLVMALTHSSCQKVVGSSVIFGRLEFLGDSVCNMAVTEYIYAQYATLNEGDLSKMRSILISGKTLARLARKLFIGTYLRIGKGQELTRGRDNDSILADTMEAVIGAMFLDSSFSIIQKFLRRELLVDIDTLLSDEKMQNYKSRLLERSQRTDGSKPEYVLERAAGPAHERRRVFTVAVRVNNVVIGRGIGHNRKEAEQAAAHKALQEHFDEYIKEV